MYEDLLQIALNKEGEIVSIFDVPTGKVCNCFCPKCEESLIAKNKNKVPGQTLKEGQKIAHFSHEPDSECHGAAETAIHLLAKVVLKKYRTLLIPPLIVKSCLVSSEKKEIFDKVEIEEPIKTESFTIKPDATLYKKFNKKEYKVLVEFKKTHTVDYEKKEKIKKLNISCIEIDVNNIEPLKNGEINEYDIKKLLEENITSKKWINNSKSSELYSKYLNLKLQKQPSKDLNSLLAEGYKLLKVRGHDWFRNSFGIRDEDLLGSLVQNIYCPRINRKEQNKRIDLNECKKCVFHKKVIYEKDSVRYVVCGFENNLKR